jgi:hypothetical protein
VRAIRTKYLYRVCTVRAIRTKYLYRVCTVRAIRTKRSTASVVAANQAKFRHIHIYIYIRRMETTKVKEKRWLQ